MVTMVTATIGLAVASLIVYLIRRDRLHVRHGFSWILVAASFAVVGMFPGLVDWTAVKLGIGYPPILAITLAFAMLVVKILVMDIEQSQTETQLQRLVQKVAILESRIRELQEAGERDEQ